MNLSLAVLEVRRLRQSEAGWVTKPPGLPWKGHGGQVMGTLFNRDISQATRMRC